MIDNTIDKRVRERLELRGIAHHRVLTGVNFLSYRFKSATLYFLLFYNRDQSTRSVYQSKALRSIHSLS